MSLSKQVPNPKFKMEIHFFSFNDISVSIEGDSGFSGHFQLTSAEEFQAFMLSLIKGYMLSHPSGKNHEHDSTDS